MTRERTRADFEAEGWVFEMPQRVLVGTQPVWVARAKREPQTVITHALTVNRVAAKLLKRMNAMREIPPEVIEAANEIASILNRGKSAQEQQGGK